MLSNRQTGDQWGNNPKQSLQLAEANNESQTSAMVGILFRCFWSNVGLGLEL
jgi:hypothetical protein